MGTCRSVDRNVSQQLSYNDYENIEFTEGECFEGEMEDGFAEGWGVYVKKNGDKYIGWWHNGKQHGEGQEIYADKTEYLGTFVNGQKHGWGTIKFPDGSSYEGQFVYDQFSGEGIYTYSNGMQYIGTKYSSIWVGGMGIRRKGWQRQYSQREVYLIANDLRSGDSRFQWPNGCEFQSNWVEGQLQGTSKLLANGTISVGEWMNNNCIKWEVLGD